MTFHGISTFTENIATGSGGGIFVEVRTTLMIEGDVMFVGNEAMFGGGLSFEAIASSVSFIGNTTIVKNRAYLWRRTQLHFKQ